MDEDRLLREFARLAREEAEDEEACVPAHWDELTAGTLPPEEEERLRAEAAESEQTRAAYEAFRPLGNEFHTRVFDAARAPGPLAEASPVISFPRPNRRWWPLAAAALVALAFGLRWFDAPDDRSYPPLPVYKPELEGAQTQRTADAGPQTTVLTPGVGFRLQLRPRNRVDAEVEGRCFVVRDGDWRPWPVAFHIDSGALRVDQRMEGELELEPGAWTLVTVVAHRGALPSSRVVRKRYEAGESAPADAGWRWHETPFTVESGGPALDVIYGGCAAVLASGPSPRPVCILASDKALDLWVKSDLEASFEITAGPRRWEKEKGVPVDNGWRFRLEPLDAGELVVRAFEEDDESIWKLALEPPRFADLDEAKDIVRRGSFEDAYSDARRFLEARLEVVEEPLEAGVLRSYLARLAQDPEQALAGIHEALELHRQAGNLSYQVDDLTFLFYQLFYQLGDLEGARKALFDQIPEDTASNGDAAYLVEFYRGQWAMHTGNTRQALGHLDTAVRHAKRLSRVRERHMAQQVLAHHLRRLGRHETAANLLGHLVAEIDELPSRCDRAKLLNNVAWDRLLALEARLPVANPLPELERARGLMEFCPEQDRDDRVSLRLNLSLAYLHAGDLGRAQQELDLSRSAGLRPGTRILSWQIDLAGRLAMARGELATAVEHFDALTILATAADWPGVGWRAAVGRALALAATGRIEDAFEALDRAEAFLDEESLRAPIDAGRETSVVAREWGTRLYLDLLIRHNRPAAALEVARRARSRFFRGLTRDARQQALDADEEARWNVAVGRYNHLRSKLEQAVASDWKIPTQHSDALKAERDAQRRELERVFDGAIALLDAEGPFVGEPPGIRPGELLLAYHPAPDGWFAFAADSETVAVHRFAAFDLTRASPAEFAAWLLEPFAERIAGAERLRVLPYGALRAIDFHALPFAGDVLAAAVPVAYGLDLPVAAARTGRRALLISDPTGSLPGASREVEDAKRALEGGKGWDVNVLRPDEGIDQGRKLLSQVREHLPRVDLLHFAGHADFVGRRLGSALEFDRDRAARLTVGDILTGPGVPATVVLSACETAQTAPGAPTALGVAHAFLIAGSQVAIGATRPVDDAVTTALVRHFYAAWDGTLENAAAALAGAQIALRETPDADWAAFRVLER